MPRQKPLTTVRRQSLGDWRGTITTTPGAIRDEFRRMHVKPEPKTQAARVAAYRARRKTRSIDIDGAVFDRLARFRTASGLTISQAIDALLDAEENATKNNHIHTMNGA